MELEEFDKRLLAELLRDARRSYRQLADTLQVSTGTVLKHIKDMERAGIIKGYSAMLEHRLLGYTITIVMEVTMSKGRLLEMEREIAKIPNVCAVYDTTGTTDAIIVAKFKSIDELSNFTKHVLSLPYVERTNTHVVLNTIKEDFRLL
ncbi:MULTISPECIES: Lrp/AsnC family transcriptional regulator [Candidatus Nitrosocaldus]|jgi:DNA-binding Lrp family transcriptional regulator|uniref:HTH asnC-type domain-containing protein n=1 Tax=Candidatus Nitrosocaldus cavascurensis TaxID=2058097 RepID=A0A2K5ARW7_9ARCH|nr:MULTISPECIES: Lrp/AsnC family transcriptional regulator [Candidatus Nitrosocaldus]SPC34377.1 conserved protein of unknown function [Candidatus Nitrosocaldus cavascurensis]